MSVVTVDERYRVVLPKQVRERLGIKPGAKVYVYVIGKEARIKVLEKDPSLMLAEILGDIEFSREDRRQAEELLLREAGVEGSR